ncbi:hypothetical protein BDD43_2798 [Mucilaginibacter gracilis]|uniref:DUF306 domain-containing protein n=1 Tax=Mucilaginibacter gracilis TaxID=423350 RepID=A0A495J1F9_9SPHI|nr:hypothetical protein [Mucilaginibacter gracilis]RKR82613.1 hypothetical protein BDD43_2798 [Mucilaginibacter gracilis]
MKKTTIFLLCALTAAIYGCSKQYNNTQVPVPTGTFTGKFTRLHQKTAGHGFDTTTANITLYTSNARLFKVSGDTSTLHAGSHGRFALNTVYIQFADSTSTAAPQAKIHLNGLYQYYYDGAIFQIAARNDTLSYIYDLKKIN